MKSIDRDLLRQLHTIAHGNPWECRPRLQDLVHALEEKQKEEEDSKSKL
jgi:hypothetical protein